MMPERKGSDVSSARGGLLKKVYELEKAKASEGAIVEQDGLFSISKNVETKFVKIDPNFKELVDSVLK